MLTRRTLLHAVATGSALAAGTAAAGAPALAEGPAPSRSVAPTDPKRPARLTNLAHLRFLLAPVPLPALEGHSTFRQDQAPSALAPWTYADRQADGGFRPVGGGSLDAATGHWSQGAFNADDISRAAVVFLRAHAAFGSSEDLETARELLRSLTYLQTDSGPDAGNVVLWQQSDGSLNPSAEPVELPDPSDSDESYWLARTVWALGEGVAAFANRDAEFADFLRGRLGLALDALERASLSRYGTWEIADGVRIPGWLITGGADATGEAVLGLAAHMGATPSDSRARRALERYAEAIAAMASGARAVWPYGAILPWTGSQSLWHAWGGLAPAGLAAANGVTGGGALLEAAIADVGVFTPQLLTSGGPHNAWSPVPGEAQIAYGVHSRVASLLAVADRTGGAGLLSLAGITAGWFFGANPAGTAVYDPATGVTVDGIEVDGRLNRNSGAESTIHALLTMIELDRRPDVAALATSLRSIVGTEGQVWLDAEDAQLSGGASIVQPDSAWTGESNWHGAYVAGGPGARIRFDLTGLPAATTGAAAPWTAHGLLHRHAETAGSSRWSAIDATGRSTDLGALDLGGAGPRGATSWEGLLKPFPLRVPVPAGTVAIEVVSDGSIELDALMLLPAVTSAVYATARGQVVLRASTAADAAPCPVRPGETGSAYAPDGRRLGPTNHGRSAIPAGAFAITTR